MSVHELTQSEKQPGLFDRPQFLAHRLEHPGNMFVGLNRWHEAVNTLLSSDATGPDKYLKLTMGTTIETAGYEAQPLFLNLVNGAVEAYRIAQSNSFSAEERHHVEYQVGRALAWSMVWERRAAQNYIDWDARTASRVHYDMTFPAVATAIVEEANGHFDYQPRVFNITRDGLLDLLRMGVIDEKEYGQYGRQLLTEILVHAAYTQDPSHDALQRWLTRMRDTSSPYTAEDDRNQVIRDFTTTVLTYPNDFFDRNVILYQIIRYYEHFLVTADITAMIELLLLTDMVPEESQKYIRSVISRVSESDPKMVSRYYRIALISNNADHRVAAQVLLRERAVVDSGPLHMTPNAILHDFSLGFEDKETQVRKAALISAMYVLSSGNIEDRTSKILQAEILNTLRSYDDIRDMYPRLIILSDPELAMGLLSNLLSGMHLTKTMEQAKSAFASMVPYWIWRHEGTLQEMESMKSFLTAHKNRLGKAWVNSINTRINDMIETSQFYPHD